MFTYRDYIQMKTQPIEALRIDQIQAVKTQYLIFSYNAVTLNVLRLVSHKCREEAERDFSLGLIRRKENKMKRKLGKDRNFE